MEDAPMAPTPAPEPEPAPPAAAPAAPPVDKAARRRESWNEFKLDLKLGSVLLLVALLIIGGAPWQAWQAPMDGTENLGDVTNAFFSQGAYAADGSAPAGRPGDAFDQPGLLIPFEVLSVLLLAALIAGVVIAIRDPEGGD